MSLVSCCFLVDASVLIWEFKKMESLLKKILGDNVKGTLDLMEKEEVDEEAFLNLDSSHLKEMG